MFCSAVKRGEQRLRAGIVVRIVERLHADLQQHLVAFAARARDPALEIGAVGREREGHGAGSFASASAVPFAPMPSPSITMAMRGASARPACGFTGRA